MMEKAQKPFGGKCYGSIGHLPNSRIGPGDHHCHDGQGVICTTKARDKHDRIIVQEKLDGSCVAVGILNGEVLALTRAGYLATTSKYEQHGLFAYWVRLNAGRFRAVLNEGERLCGEWLAQAHATRYDLTGREPFVAFDLIVSGTGGGERLCVVEFLKRVETAFKVPARLQFGDPISVQEALRRLGDFGYYGALDEVEGVVYRVERLDQKSGRYAVDFLAKYVRPEKKDGIYLPEVSGKPAIWNWRPEAAA